MKCYYKLNLDFDFIKSDDILYTPRHQEHLEVRWLTDSVNTNEYLTEPMKEFLKNNDITIYSYMGDNTMSLFRGQPSGYLEPHIDRGTCWAINYVTGTDNSEMVWYNLKEGVGQNDGYEIPTFFNPNATYHAYYYEQLAEIDRAKMKGLYLVRIDVPHSIHNNDPSNARFCFSLKDARNKWTWEEAVERLKNYLIYE